MRLSYMFRKLSTVLHGRAATAAAVFAGGGGMAMIMTRGEGEHREVQAEKRHKIEETRKCFDFNHSFFLMKAHRGADKHAGHSRTTQLGNPLSHAFCEASVENPQKSETGYKEQTTGVVFPSELSVDWINENQRIKPHRFVGAAPRIMQNLTWLPIARAYALGVFVDAEVFEAIKTQTKEGKADVTDLFRACVPKTFSFVFLGGKPKKHVLDGFRRSLLRACDSGEGEKDVNAFCALLGEAEFKKNAELLVTISRDYAKGDYGVYVFFRDDRESPDPPRFLGRLSSEHVFRSLCTLYFGIKGEDSKPVIYEKMRRQIITQANQIFGN